MIFGPLLGPLDKCLGTFIIIVEFRDIAEFGHGFDFEQSAKSPRALETEK